MIFLISKAFFEFENILLQHITWIHFYTELHKNSSITAENRRTQSIHRRRIICNWHREHMIMVIAEWVIGICIAIWGFIHLQHSNKFKNWTWEQKGYTRSFTVVFLFSVTQSRTRRSRVSLTVTTVIWFANISWLCSWKCNFHCAESTYFEKRNFLSSYLLTGRWSGSNIGPHRRNCNWLVMM